MDSPLVRRTLLGPAPLRLLAFGLGFALADGAFREGALAKMDPPKTKVAPPQQTAARHQLLQKCGALDLHRARREPLDLQQQQQRHDQHRRLRLCVRVQEAPA